MNPKDLIRSLVLTNRKLLSDAFIKEKSQLIARQLGKFFEEQNAIRRIHIFLPIKRNREVDTWKVIHGLGKSYEFVASKTDFKHHQMQHFVINEDTKFVSDKMGIPTPINGIETSIDDIDLVLIPLLATDLRGNRIGYGQGYYDQLISQLPPGALKVGLNMTGLFDHFPFMEPHDQKLDYCITPYQIIDCKHV